MSALAGSCAVHGGVTASCASDMWSIAHKPRASNTSNRHTLSAVNQGMVALVATVGDSAGAELYAQSHLEAGMADMAPAPDQSCAGGLKLSHDTGQQHAAHIARILLVHYVAKLFSHRR